MSTVNTVPDAKLVSRISEALSEKEQIVFITKMDLIAILPKAMRTVFTSILLLMVTAATWNIGFGMESVFPSTGIISRICMVIIAIVWVKFILDTLQYNYEIFAITKTEKSGPKAYLRRGFFKKKWLPVKLSSLVATPIDQSKHFYQPILGVGNIRLDVFGSEDGDVFLKDIQNPLMVVNLINRLLSEKNQ